MTDSLRTCKEWRKAGEPPCCECTGCVATALAHELAGKRMPNTHWTRYPDCWLCGQAATCDEDPQRPGWFTRCAAHSGMTELREASACAGA